MRNASPRQRGGAGGANPQAACPTIAWRTCSCLEAVLRSPPLTFSEPYSQPASPAPHPSPAPLPAARIDWRPAMPHNDAAAGEQHNDGGGGQPAAPPPPPLSGNAHLDFVQIPADRLQALIAGAPPGTFVLQKAAWSRWAALAAGTMTPGW